MKNKLSFLIVALVCSVMAWADCVPTLHEGDYVLRLNGTKDLTTYQSCDVDNQYQVLGLALEVGDLLTVKNVVYGLEDGGASANFTYNKDNGVTCKTAGTYDVYIKSNLSVLYIGSAAAETTYYLAGNMNEWSATGAAFVDGKVVLQDLAAGDHQFKVTDGQWNKDGDGGHEFTTVDSECSTATTTTDGDGNVVFTTYKVQDVTIEFADSKICVKADTEKPADIEDVYVIAGQEALLGVDWDGNAESNKMTVVDGTATLVKENLTLAAGTYLFKVVKNGSTWIPDGVGNDSELAIEEVGEYTVTFTYIIGEESATAVAVKNGEEPQPEYVTVRFFYADWATVYIFAWGGSDFGTWPGKLMTKDESGWFAEKILKGSNIIFNAGEGQPQTIDITNVEADLCYELGDVNDEGKYSVVVNEMCQLKTSVDNNAEEAKVMLIGNKLVVTINGSANVSVFNMAGQMIDNQMATGSYTRNLASGIYLIRVDGQSYKAVIR